MARVKVKLADNITRVVFLETDATVGATLGTNLFLPDGSVATPTTFATWLGVSNSSGGSTGVTAHRLLSGLTLGNDHSQYPLKASAETISGQWNFTQQVRSANGTVALPGFTFTTDTNTGVYRVGEDDLGFSTNGTLRLDISTTAFTATLPWRGQDGTVAAPAFSFSGDTDNGMYRIGTNNVGVAVAGAKVLDIATTGVEVVGTSHLGLTTAQVAGVTGLGIAGTAFYGQVRGILVRAGASPVFQFTRINGSLASPTAVALNDSLGAFTFSGYDGSTVSQTAQFASLATEAWSGSARGSAVTVRVTPVGTITETEATTWGSNSTGTYARGPDGAVGQPGWSFVNDTDTGLYRIGSNNLGVSVGGTKVLDLNATNGSSVVQFNWAGLHLFEALITVFSNSGGPTLRMADTDAATNAKNYRMRNNSGVFALSTEDDAAAVGATVFSVARTGTVVDSFTLGTVLLAPDGAVGAPSHSFTNDADCGLYRIGTNNLGVAVAGAKVLDIATTGLAVTGLVSATGTISGTNLSATGGANPTASAGLAAVNGSAITYMRSDGAPAISQSIAPTWSGRHTFSNSSNAGAIEIASTLCSLNWNETDQAVNARVWRLVASGSTFLGQTLDDAISAAKSWLEVTRTLNAISTVRFGNTTDNPTFSFLGTGTVTLGGVTLGPNGAVGAPSYAFTNDADCGMYRIGTNNIGLSAAGAKVLDISATGLLVVGTTLSGDGTVALPGLGFSGDTDCGMYRIGADNVGIAVAGAKVLDIATTGLTVTGTITTSATTFLHRTTGTLANGAAAQAGTLLNAPAAGNPTKWIPIDDNGTTRYIPAW